MNKHVKKEINYALLMVNSKLKDLIMYIRLFMLLVGIRLAMIFKNIFLFKNVIKY